MGLPGLRVISWSAFVQHSIRAARKVSMGGEAVAALSHCQAHVMCYGVRINQHTVGGSEEWLWHGRT